MYDLSVLAESTPYRVFRFIGRWALYLFVEQNGRDDTCHYCVVCPKYKPLRYFFFFTSEVVYPVYPSVTRKRNGWCTFFCLVFTIKRSLRGSGPQTVSAMC